MFFKKKSRMEQPNSPMDLRYMKRLKFYLYIMDAWPFKELYDFTKEKPRHLPTRSHKALFVIWSGILLGGLAYLATHVRKLSFFEIGHSYITVLLNVIAVQRVSMSFMKSYRQTSADFVQKIHLFHHKNKSDYALKINNQVHKLSSFYTQMLYVQMYAGILFFNLTPLYNNFKSGVFDYNNSQNGTRYEHSVYYYIPFEYHNFGYLVIFTANWFISFDCSSSFCTLDLLLSLIVFHVWGHLKILKYHLENFPRPIREKRGVNSVETVMYSDEEYKKVLKLLKKNIEHHRMIMQFMSQASEAFGPMMCFYYTFQQVSGCILLLEVSALDTAAIGSYGILTLMIFQQLIQISVVFELMGSKSETIKDAVYSIPWECMHVRNRKVVLFFLYNSQTVIALKAMGMISVGVQTMAAIIKTSFSYFIMLRAIADN